MIDGLAARKILEEVLTERFQHRADRQPILTQLTGDRGYEGLPTMARGQQARHLIEWLAEIVAIAQFRRTGMQCHPDTNWRL